ncbi:MAG TPA: type II secretion system F family protein [Thermodesulfobacteriaceae bacterium]|nr:type II secretion system F family protein [Thermodesulfobacteriaceae bacterium]
MPAFVYEALDAKGNRISGTDQAESQDLLISSLISQGLQPIRVRRLRRLQTFFSSQGTKFSHEDLLYFTRELADLLEAGVSLERSLAIVADASDKENVRSVIDAVKHDIHQGRRLSEALSGFQNIFNPLYINMVRVGEMGGVLPAVLKRLDDFLERSRHIRNFIISTSIYPSILALVGIFSVVVLVTFVVPKFGQIFEDLNQPMPVLTRIIVGASQFLRTWWWLILLSLAGITAGFCILIKTPEGSRWWDRIKLRLPVAGPMLLRIELGRLCRTLGTLLESGVPILKGISLASEVVSNRVIREAVSDLYRGVRQGKSLSQLMKRTSIFPSLMVHLVAIGEETGGMGVMLLKIAEDLEEKVQNDTKMYLSMVEPLTIILMGLIIGGIILSMLMAIFGINDVSF